MTKTTIGFWLVILAMVFGGGAAVLAVMAPALIADGLVTKDLLAYLVAGGATGAVVLAPMGLGLVG